MTLLSAIDGEIINKCFKKYLSIGDSLSLSEKHKNEKDMYSNDMIIVKEIWQEGDKNRCLETGTYTRTDFSESKVLENFINLQLSLEVKAFLDEKFNDSILSKISFCNELICDYHDLVYSCGNECSKCMALVVKFFVLLFEAININKNMISYHKTRKMVVVEMITRYLKFIKNNKLDRKVTELFFEMFNNERSFLNLCILWYKFDIRLYLNVMQTLNLKKPKVITEYDGSSRLEITHDCLYWGCFSSFIAFIEYGATNSFQPEVCDDYYKLIYNFNFSCKMSDSQLHSKDNLLKMRIFQVSVMHGCKKGCPTPEVITIEEALRVLWNSISEPFLTRRDLSKRVWKWYDKHVAKGKSTVLSPRSLQHLARCSIRNSLAEGFNLPNGVNLLSHYPLTLKKYILLQEN